MAFRSKKTVAQLVRNFGIARIVKTCLNNTADERGEMSKTAHQQKSLTTLEEKNNDVFQAQRFEETGQESIGAYKRKTVQNRLSFE